MKSPSSSVGIIESEGIRNGSKRKERMRSTIRIIGKNERAYSTIHEGAVYLHLGEQYLVEDSVTSIFQVQGKVRGRADVAPGISEAQLWRLARQVASITHQGISREHPLLSATLPDGARVQVVAPPATRGFLALAIRKHVSPHLGLADYVASGEQFGMIKLGSRTELVLAREAALDLKIKLSAISVSERTMEWLMTVSRLWTPSRTATTCIDMVVARGDIYIYLLLNG